MTDLRPAYVQRIGAGPRDLLALHCTLAHGGTWRGVSEALENAANVIAMDLPGHGRNPLVATEVDFYEHCIAQAGALLTQPMHLAGHSFGAVAALRLALEKPDLVRSLTLVEPVLFAAVRTGNPSIFAAYAEQMKPFEQALAEGDDALAARLFNRYWGDGTGWDTYPEPVRDYMTRRIGLVTVQAGAVVEDSAGILAPGRLEACSTPILIVEGEHTPPVIRAIHEVLQQRLPKVRRIVIAGARHMAVQTHPEQLAAAMLELFEVAQE